MVGSCGQQPVRTRRHRGPGLHSRGRVRHIWAEFTQRGQLEIAGQDLGPPSFMGGEYEYFLTVEPGDRS